MLLMDSRECLDQTVSVVTASHCSIQTATTLRWLTPDTLAACLILCSAVSSRMATLELPANHFPTAGDDRGVRNRARNRDVLDGTRR